MSKGNILSNLFTHTFDIFSNSVQNHKKYYIKKEDLSKIRNKVKNIESDISKLKIKRNKLNKEYNEKKETLELINESIKDINKQKLLYEIVQLEHKKEKLSIAKKNLSEDVNKLIFQKGMLESEIINLEEKKKGIFTNNNNSLSIEYIDNLTNGLDFEKCFANILKCLGYIDVEVTTSSSDFGIDVLARDTNNILYGFQCKLYSNPVGNDAVQQAYSGKEHYNCDIVIVVTNNIFTKQAIQQAYETQVILWDRKILISKLKLLAKS